MNTNKLNTARRLVRPSWLIVLLLVLSSSYVSPEIASAAGARPLFDAPATPLVHDEVVLLSTRSMGTVCTGNAMEQGLQCQRLVYDLSGTATWKSDDWHHVLSHHANLPTVVYVHGNRVEDGNDKLEGQHVYRSFKAHCQSIGPVRFIIWSWPSGQIPGPIKDYLVKAKLTTPVAWQLAWFLDKLSEETEVSLLGFSYGTRVVSGSTHLLAGGKLGQLQLAERQHPSRPPVKAALMAAAYDADWLQSDRFYGRSLTQIKRLILATNERDPAMRFYHLSNGRGRMHALGKSGVYQPTALGEATRRLGRVDFTRNVGRSHALTDYLAAKDKMSIVWRELMPSSLAVDYDSVSDSVSEVSGSHSTTL